MCKQMLAALRTSGCCPDSLKDQELLGESDSKAANSKRLELEKMTNTAENTPAILDTKIHLQQP